MIKPGTIYRIVGVHDRDVLAYCKEKLYGAFVEALELKRWPPRKDCPSGYYYGVVRFVTPVKGKFAAGDEFKFFAVYLRRVKEKVK